jgi:hypothetical protein
LPAPAGTDEKGVLAGRVLDEGGKPVAGAKLSLWAKGKSRPVGQTGPDGRFRLELTKDDLAGQPKLVVRAKGRGPDWVELGKRPAGEVTFRLREEVPIQGRLRDLEGRPVAGAQVTVEEVGKTDKDDLDPFIEAWKNIMSGAPIPRLRTVPPAALSATTTTKTDREGKFRVTGVGRERHVTVTVRGKGIEHQHLWVVTRPGFKKTRNFHGPSLDLLVGPGKEVVGVVRERGTGKPAVGVTVACFMSQATTDEKGRFRLEGLPKRETHFVSARGKDYFMMMRQVKDTPGREPIRVSLEVQRGIRVTGRLLDEAGKPVSGVVSYFIKSDNPYLKKSVFSQGVGLGSGPAGPDGKFSMLVIPGPGYLAAQADRNIYARATLEGWDGAPVGTAPHALFPYYYHAIVSIDPDVKKPASMKCDVVLSAGRTRPGTVVGPDGKPVVGAIAFGLTAIPDPGERTIPRPTRFGPPPPDRLKGSSFTAFGLNPKEPRHLVFVHPEKKLGKVLRFRGDEKGPLVVKLEPLGAVGGRALADGKPAAGRFVTPRPPNLFAFYKDYPIELMHNQYRPYGSGRNTRWLPEVARTDAQGKFRLEGLLPRLKYTLWVTDRPLGQLGIVREVTLKSGETRDLGDVKSPGMIPGE